jgi:hypothetical protein
MRRMMKWIRDPASYPIPKDVVKDRFYMYRTLDGEISFSSYINFDLIKHMMEKEGIFFFNLSFIK